MDTKRTKFFIYCALVLFPLISIANLDKGQQIAGIQNDIGVIESIISHNTLRKNDIINELANLKFQQTAAQKVIRIIVDKERVTDFELNKLKGELESLQQEVTTAKNQYKKILIQEQKYRDYKSKLLFLISSKSINQFLSRLRQLERLKSFRKKHLRAVVYKQEELANKIAVFEGTDKEKSDLVYVKQEQRSKLDELIESRNVLLQGLDKESNLLQLKLNENLKTLATLQGTINEKFKAIDQDQKATVLKQQADWPVSNGLIVGRFGVQSHNTIHKIKVENNGIDILVNQNQHIVSVLDGTVKAVFEIPGSNYSVIVQHGTFYSAYANLLNPTIEVGDEIKKGELLGTIGMNDENLYKLHFELWNGTKKVNPENYLEER